MSWPFALPLPRLPGPSLMSTFEPTEPPAEAEVPPADAAAPPDTLPDVLPGTAPMPGTPWAARFWLGDTFMPCVLPVFCEADVDWFVVACESM